LRESESLVRNRVLRDKNPWWMAPRQRCRAKVGRGSMQTKVYGSGDEPQQSHGLRGVEHREVKVGLMGIESETRRGKSFDALSKGPTVDVGCDCRSLAQDGGGQGVLSHPEGEGLRAHRARGRATPTKRSKAVSRNLHQRSGFRKDETDCVGASESWGKRSQTQTDHKAAPVTAYCDGKRSLVPDRGQEALRRP
jgi:hypothetical protein